MRRHHPLPFGAEPAPDGATHFRVWAPSAKRVALALADGSIRPMALEAGWATCTAPVGPGTRYRYLIDDHHLVPDVAARSQPGGVHGDSAVVAPTAYDWQDTDWRGRPWSEAVVYELHVGTFSPSGDFAGVEAKLDHLVALGVTALELMPLAHSPGARGWGYDGVLPFAPWSAYGRPEDLKRLVEQAHLRGLMVLLDVVYNHFGPEGNYLGHYARPAFDPRAPTPWGDGFAFARPEVRDLFVHNALYWLHEYHFDGLRLDAIEYVAPALLREIATRVRASTPPDRHVHLVLEAVDRQDDLLDSSRGPAYSAQWSEHIQRPLHVLATGETRGRFARFASAPLDKAACALTTGSAQPETEARARGLPRTAFVAYSTNHDQIGNRAQGDRVLEAHPERALALQALLLLSPSVPMLFMGEEWGATSPFMFFSDLEPMLHEGVKRGRAEYLKTQPGFTPGRAVPSPFANLSFTASRLRWQEREAPRHRAREAAVRRLLEARREHLVPRIPSLEAGTFEVNGAVVRLSWPGDGGAWRVIANLGRETEGRVARQDFLASTHEEPGLRIPAWFVGAWWAAR